MKELINIHILPTYKVDIIDKFTKYDPNNTKVGDLVEYDKLLTLLSKYYIIQDIKISGGEISKLSDLYFDILYKIVKLYTDNIEIFTNFVSFNEALINGADIINVNYNFDTDNSTKKRILANIKAAIQIGKIVNLKTLDIACIDEPSKIISFLNKLNIKTWEIVPYQKTEYTNLAYKGYSFFEQTILNFLDYSYQMNFAFYNKLQIEGIIHLNNYNTKTIFLTPNSKLAVQVYKNNIMSLKEFDTIAELQQTLDKIQLQKEEYCEDCSTKLKCLANYYQNFNTKQKSCCGFSNLVSTLNIKKESK